MIRVLNEHSETIKNWIILKENGHGSPLMTSLF